MASRDVNCPFLKGVSKEHFEYIYMTIYIYDVYDMSLSYIQIKQYILFGN